jgi:hypothetical protein
MKLTANNTVPVFAYSPMTTSKWSTRSGERSFFLAPKSEIGWVGFQFYYVAFLVAIKSAKWLFPQPF